MVWNIQFQIAGLILVVLVAIMCFGQRRLSFWAERAYTRLLLGVVTCLVLDILSVCAINYRYAIGNHVCGVVCKFYLLSIIIVGYLATLFALAEIKYPFKKFWSFITPLPVVVGIFVLLHIKVLIHAEEGEVYTYGWAVWYTYFASVIYLVAILGLVIVCRRRIEKNRMQAMIFWIVAWIGTAVIQFTNNQLLLVGYAMALACLYMYCKLENPESNLDYSTNMFNRKAFAIVMSEAMKRHDKGAIINITLGELGTVNEVFGSRNVESIMRIITDYIQEIPDSALFRLEDNLFCLVLRKPDKVEDALEALVKRFGKSWEFSGMHISIDLHLSYFTRLERIQTVTELEDIIHYFAVESIKRPGREILHINDEELAKRKKSLELVRILSWAIRNERVEVYYQPIYGVKQGKFCAMEALVRIYDQNDNMYMPTDFIPFAEKNGMILKLGEIIFREVCQFIQHQHIEDYGIEFVEVNLSVVQCMQEDLARVYKNIMGEYGVPPYRINLEITETAAIRSKIVLDRNMKELIRYGTSFSLDDYGSGYSNLTYIVNLPVRFVKIDKELTEAYFSSKKAQIATKYSIDMMHQLGMEIIVEGIETEEQYQAFRDMGADNIQGFYFSKPLPKDRVLKYIQEWL